MPPAEGMVRVLMAARPIPAYSRVSRDDLFDPARRVFAYVDLEEEFVEENEVLRGTSAIVGRVLKRNKRSGFVFTEDDFLPKGTRPGLVGGIPAGMRAMRIERPRRARRVLWCADRGLLLDRVARQDRLAQRVPLPLSSALSSMTPSAQRAAKSASANNRLEHRRPFQEIAWSRSVSDRARPISTPDPAVEPTSPVAPAVRQMRALARYRAEFV